MSANLVSRSLNLHPDPRLFQNSICQMSRRNLPVHDKAGVVDGALPDVVIALTMADEGATMFKQDCLDLPGIAGRHQAAIARCIS